MKKILPLAIVAFLVISGLGAVATNNDLEKLDLVTINYKNIGNEGRDFTHTVFAEYGTATWCGYCKYAHGALKNIYAAGTYPFYYVSLVDDKNSIAAARNDQYNIYGFPTVWFDGGYKVNVGAGSIPAAQAAYESSINACGIRPVEDIDISLTVTWLGGTEMQISAQVDNNEAATYGGHIRVYITEIESSMGWYDTAGQLYTFPLLDYAFNEPVSISAGGSWQDSTTWDGTSHGFPSITEDNIMVIAAVFNDEWHQGYSYPPSSNPFNAYYVDDAVGTTPGGGGGSPNTPSTPNGPTNGVVGTEYTFYTTTTDPEGDQIYYLFDWGDGTDSGWLGPHNSGEEGSASKTWTNEGTYNVRAKAKDVSGHESGWSNVHQITIASGPILDVQTITGGLFRVNTIIKNTGSTDANNVQWSINLVGGTILLGGSTTGEIENIPAGGQATINSKFILGFGSTQVEVTAEIPDGPTDYRSQGASVFLFYIRVNPGGGL